MSSIPELCDGRFQAHPGSPKSGLKNYLSDKQQILAVFSYIECRQ
jgi:hypothetical protein